MSESKVELNLYQKLAKVRKVADAVRKDKKGYGYKYTDINEILAKVTGCMNKQGISLVPKIAPGTVQTETITSVNTKVDQTGSSYDKKTTETLVRAEMFFEWVNDSNPSERITVPWLLLGSQADPSQAFGSGLTYCTRYFLTEYFQIGQTETDVDNYRSKQKEAEAAEDIEIAQQIINELHRLVELYLEEHSDARAELKKFFGKYVRSSDYFKIKEPELASKLLNDFKNTYMD